MVRFAAVFGLLFLVLSLGCAEQAMVNVQAHELKTPQIQFVDLPKFDRLLSEQLSSEEKNVDVVFYDKVSPNQLPQRLQKWLTAIEQKGGAIDVAPPPGDPAPRNPALLLGLLGGLMSSLKALGAIQEEQLLRASAGHEATLMLDKNSHGDVFIERIVFKKTSK